MNLVTETPARPLFQKKTTLAVALIALIAASSLAGLYLFTTQQKPASGTPSGSLPVAASVSIKVYNGSTLKSSVTQDDDMVMNNFMNFLSNWFGYVGPGSTPSTFAMTDTAGTARTLEGREATSSYQTCTWVCEDPNAPYSGGYIAVGTGTASPARTDYKLGSQYQSLVGVVAAPTYDPSTGDIIFGVNILAGTSASISEVGFFESWWVSSVVGWDTFLMFHDSFTTQSVTAGNTISVQYTVQLGSTAYDNNFGILLAAILGNSNGAAVSVNLTPTSGTAQTVSVYVPEGSISYAGYSSLRADLGAGSTGADSTIRVGTGSTSTCPDNSAAGFAQSRSAVNLCNPVLSYTPINSYVFSPYVAVTAVTPTAVAYTFTEAGYFQSFGSPTYTFLLIRNVFTTPLAVTADSSITTTYEFQMS